MLEEANINNEQKQPPDFLKYARNSIDRADVDDSRIIKYRIVPLLLTSYDADSVAEIKKIREELVKEGYINTLLIEDIDTKMNFNKRYDAKFLRCLQTHRESEYFIIPLFYFSSPDRKNQGLGHHSELVDLITFFRELVFVTGIFYYEDANMLNQKRIIPAHNHFKVNNFDEHLKKVKEFVNAYFPFIERNQLFSKEKDIYITKEYYMNRGDINEKG